MLFTQAISASVGAGLLAIVVNDDAYLRLTHRYREQARSHMGTAQHSDNLSAFAHRQLALSSISPKQPKGG